MQKKKTKSNKKKIVPISKSKQYHQYSNDERTNRR